MAKKLGNALLLIIGANTLAATTSQDISFSRGEIDATSKDSTADYKETLLGRKEASISVEGQYDPAASTGTGALDVFDLMDDGTSVTVKWGETTTGGKYFTASGYVKDFSLSGPLDEVATWTATITLTGAVTVGTVS